MSWDTRVAQEAIVVYFVRCSTCGLNKQFDNEYEAERERAAHHRAHDERWYNNEMDLGYDLNPDPLTQRTAFGTPSWSFTDNPDDPCVYCVQWRPVDPTVVEPDMETPMEPYWPDGSVAPLVCRNPCERCSEAVSQMHD